MDKIYLVYGYDVGGNTGSVLVAAFTTRADAEHFAQHSKRRDWNDCFGSRGAEFTVEEDFLYHYLDEAYSEELIHG